MKKRQRLMLASTMALLMLLAFLVPLTTVFAADLTNTLDFITNVQLTDRAGNPFGSDIPKDAELRLTYDYAIANDHDGVGNLEGHTIRLPIPNEIILTAGPPIELKDGDHLDDPDTNGLIATVTKVFNTPPVKNELLVTFTKHADIYSDVSGSFYMNLAFDETHIGNDDPTDITFEIGGSTGTQIIKIDFDQPPPPETSVQKTGTYNAATNEIEWTVTVNPEKVTVTDGVLVDDIPSGLTFVSDSVKIKEGAAAERDAVLGVDYTYTDPTMTYTLTTPTSDTHIVKFKTTVDETEFIFANSHGVTITKDNTIRLNHDGTFKEDTSNNVSIPIYYIEKTGSYDSVDKQIDWTIIINQNGVTIPNAVLTDTLPADLTLDTDSIEIDDVPIVWPDTNITYTDPDLTIDIGGILGSISEQHKIEFSTYVATSVYEENGDFEISDGFENRYTNTAVLAGTNVPDNANDANDDPVGVATTVLRKVGGGTDSSNPDRYDRENAEITWIITVNPNQISIDNPVVTDLIPTGQEYIPDSGTISGGTESHVEGFSFDATDPDASHTGTLTYTFGTKPALMFIAGGVSINETYTIKFKTRVTDENVYAANRSNVTYRNTATMTSDNIPAASDEGTQRVDSEVVDKSNEDYNYVTREIDWKIQVNENKMDLDNVVVTDNINKGMEYVAGSFMLDGVPIDDSIVYSDSPADPDAHSGTLTYNFGSITNEYNITFKTKVTDLKVFNTNGTKSFSNSATITTDLVPTGVTNSDSQPVNNTVIGKSGDYTTGNTFIDWTITVNTNDIPLTNGLISDQLQEGLALDTTSVKLYHATTNPANGNLIQGGEIALTGDNVSYSVDTRLFEFTIPAPVSGGYILTFRTDVTDKDQTPFTNEASFNGSGTLQQGAENPIAVSWSGSGSSGTGDVGSMDVVKVDRNDHSNKLAGAEFELEDMYGNIVQRVTSDGSGSALFERLRFDVDYTVREVAPPIGYLLSSEEYTFQIDSAEDNKNLTYNYENDPIVGSITFTKYDANSNPLVGAEFTLYDSGDSAVGTATSGTDGVVLFENVQYGVYTIQETTPPEGYLLSSEVLNATVTQNGVTVTATPKSLSNTTIKGNITLTKYDMVSNPLEGAVFTLYDAGNNAVGTATSTVEGVVLFENVDYGSYTIRETTPPEGYRLSSEVLSASITTEGETVTANPASISNEHVRGNISFAKYGWDSKPLAGAEFTLYDIGSNAVATAMSGMDGVVLFEDIEYGDYTIRETTPSEGYLLSSEVLNASITQDSVTVIANPASISNDIITGSIQIIKMDEDEAAPLAGASMSLFSADDTEFTSPLDTKVSGEDGIVLFENVIYGDYVIKETAAPNGYTVSERTINVSVRSHGETVDAGTYTNQKIRADIEILKNNKIGQALTGAKFGLYDTTGNLLGEAISGEDGIARFEDVLFGTYTVCEIEAPERYLLSEEIVDINIQTTETVQYTFINQIKNKYAYLINSPDTGDTIFWSVAIFIASMILVGVLFFVHGYIVKKKTKLSANK